MFLRWILFFHFLWLSYCQSCNLYRSYQIEGINSFLTKFWNEEGNYLYNEYPQKGNSNNTGYWTYAQGFDAVLDLAMINDSYVSWIPKFYQGEAQFGWDRPYYDDMNWMSLALLRASSLVTGNFSISFLNVSNYLFEKIYSAWDTTCCGETPGGIWWNVAHTSKATVSNAGPVILASRLYTLTGNVTYLQFAQKVYSFWWDNMVNKSSGQVCDDIRVDGTKVWWKFTYNEGLMIGAAVELYKVTGNNDYLSNASFIFQFVLNNEVNVTEYGLILTDGPTCGGDCTEFKGIAARYITEYYKITKDKMVYKMLQACANAVWNLARNPNTDCFSIPWNGPAPTTTEKVTESQQNSAIMALSMFAAVCTTDL